MRVPTLFLAALLWAAQTAAHKAVVQLGAYPGVGSLGASSPPPAPPAGGGAVALTYSIGGMLVVEHVEGSNMIAMRGVLTGLEASVTAGWHIHAGYTCDTNNPDVDIAGHYFPGMATDPWLAVKYASDANGVALVNVTMPQFSLEGLNPVIGRAIVVHNAAGDRVGCGLINPLAGQVAVLNSYPGYDGSSAVRGVIAVTTAPDGALAFTGTLTGLPISSTGGWHVHEGASCSSSDAPRGHFFNPNGADPWTAITYTSDTAGVASLNATITSFSLREAWPVTGHALVVHDPGDDAPRSGCGVIGTPPMGVSRLGAYPGAAANAAVAFDVSQIGGTLLVAHDGVTGDLMIDGLVTGLLPSSAGGWHVHEGFTCSTAADVGGHFFTTGSEDPWKYIAYVTDSSGVARVSARVGGFSLVDAMPVLGRAIVFHDGSGQRVGCGLIQPFTGEAAVIGGYPGYTGDTKVDGVIVVADMGTAMGVGVHGTLTGLPINSTEGWHIHSGYTCEEATPPGSDTNDRAVGGHYYSGGTDPWTAINYISDGRGVANIAMNMTAFSLYGTNPVAGRAIVVHDPSRVGCGVIGSYSMRSQLAVASVVTYPGSTITPNNVGGTLSFEYLPRARMLVVRGLVTGLNASTSGGWHIHTGYSCTSASEIGLHYYTEGTPDVWLPMSYTADSTGAATIGAAIPGFDLTGRMPVLGRALVIHNSFGDRVGCGLITPRFNGAVAALSPYPAYSGSSTVKGMLVLGGGATGGLNVLGSVSGLAPSTSGGWHVHSGVTCASVQSVFAHYWPEMATDPWLTVTYTTDERGVATISSATTPETVTALAGFSPQARRAVDGRTLVVHDPAPSAARAGCGAIGSLPDDPMVAAMVGGGGMGGGMGGSGNGIIGLLQAYTSAIGADFIDVFVVWMRTSHPALVGVVNALLIAAATVCMLPGIFMALVVGYSWTFAYGGAWGVGFGTLTMFIGTLAGSLCCFVLGQQPWCSTCVSRACRIPKCLHPAVDALADHPMRMLVLLRASPLVPFNLLNYYAGASGRFKMLDVLVAHIFTAPMTFMWVGVGGAILKWRLIDRHEASEETYMPFIWAGFSVTLAFIIISTGFLLFYARRTARASARHGVMNATNATEGTISPDGIAIISRSSKSLTPTPRAYSNVEIGGGLGEVSQVPPPPPSTGAPAALKTGWREVLSDENETYYFNDETGESQWDPPLAEASFAPSFVTASSELPRQSYAVAE